MIMQFLTNSMHGGGNIIRHLELMGYTLDYKQTACSEFDYCVDQLAVDLRDGIRLCRLADVLTGEDQPKELHLYVSNAVSCQSTNYSRTLLRSHGLRKLCQTVLYVSRPLGRGSPSHDTTLVAIVLHPGQQLLPSFERHR